MASYRSQLGLHTLFARYCAERVYDEQVIKQSFQEWLSHGDKIEWDRVFNTMSDDTALLQNNIEQSEPFLSLSRAMEYQADYFFAGLYGLQHVKIFKEGLLEMKEFFKSKEMLRSHPSLERRWRLMHVFAKLLEAEERINNKECT